MKTKYRFNLKKAFDGFCTLAIYFGLVYGLAYVGEQIILEVVK